MPKPSLDDIMDIKDPMLNDNFDFTFASIPGGGDRRQFTVQCKTAVKPGMTIQEVEVSLFGHVVNHAAKKVFSKTFTLEIIDNNKGDIARGLEDWAELIRGTDTQHGEFKAKYAVKGVLKIYNQKGDVAAEYEIKNCFPSEIPESQFDGEGGAIITVSPTFKYDVYKRTR